jgi:alkylation response protein AidB-like acyl-CoA dehydrogenase
MARSAGSGKGCAGRYSAPARWGSAHPCIEAALGYANERIVFGNSIAGYQLIEAFTGERTFRQRERGREADASGIVARPEAALADSGLAQGQSSPSQ